MKKIALLFILCLACCLAACGETEPVQTPPATTAPTTAPATAPTTVPTTAPTTVPTAVATEAPVTVPQIMDLVGSWQRASTEAEGDRVTNTNATVVISGDTEDSLTVTYTDTEFPDTNFSKEALTVKNGELYPDCGNDSWYLETAAIDKFTYCLTLLEDGTLLIQCNFSFDGMSMSSYQWFSRK